VSKLLHGNPGKREIKPEPQPQPAALDAPDFLSAEAKAEWARIAPELGRLGLLTRLDVSMLAVYAESYAQWLAAVRLFAGAPLIIPGPRGRPNPAVKLARDAAGELLRFAVEFGIGARHGRLRPPQLRV
jgi:P27 family predicted phage terminase small subunit